MEGTNRAAQTINVAVANVNGTDAGGDKAAVNSN